MVLCDWSKIWLPWALDGPGLQSYCSNQCQFRTRGWCVIVEHKTSERKGSTQAVLLHFLQLLLKREEKQRKGRWENQEKAWRECLQGAKSSHRMSVQPGILSWSMALLCCSAHHQLDALVGISGDTAAVGSILHSSGCAGTRNKGSGCKT